MDSPETHPAKKAKGAIEDRPGSTVALIDLSDYDYHPSGWYISRSDAAWQYHSTLHVLYHVSSAQYYQPQRNGKLLLVQAKLGDGSVSVEGQQQRA